MSFSINRPNHSKESHMNHLNAFYSMPKNKVDSPSKLYTSSVLVLFPVSFLCSVDMVSTTRLSNEKNIYKIEPVKLDLSQGRKIFITFIAAILFVPSLILGTLLRSIAYAQPEVRDFHSKIVLYKEETSNTQHVAT